MLLGDFVRNASDRLRDKGIETPGLDAEVIISFKLGIERYKLISERERNLSPEEIAGIEKLIRRRLKNEPVAYITGVREFYSLEFSVNRDVLIPRPETELLVDMTIYWTPQGGRLLDLCTGSGAIAVAVKHSRPDVDVAASDISDKAIRVAKKNSADLIGSGKIRFFKGHIFDPFNGEKFSVIVSNPPYIDAGLKNELQKELSYEPEVALFCGNRGRSVSLEIITNAMTYLEDEGVLIMEIASDHHEFIRSSGENSGFSVSILNDYAGLPRVVIMRRS